MSSVRFTLGFADLRSFFFRNWDSIAQSSNSTGRRTFFLDWLGMGLSSRPAPHLLSSPSNAPVPARVARAEHFFLSSLESWRESVGVDKMVLVGHSLGGYLASAYAVRYPHRVSGLILVSPAGVPHGEGYKYYKPSGERNAGDLDDAVDAAQMELEVNTEPKGEAKNWGKNQSFMRRNMVKCELSTFLFYFLTPCSLYPGLGARLVPFQYPPIDGAVGTNVRSQLYQSTILRAQRRGEEGPASIRVQHHHIEGQWRVLHMCVE